MTTASGRCHANCNAMRAALSGAFGTRIHATRWYTRGLATTFFRRDTTQDCSKLARRTNLEKSGSGRGAFGMNTLLKFFLVAADMATPTCAMAVEPFTLMFGQKTATGSETRSYFVPKYLGFFKEEGLDVTLQPTDGATQ